MEHIRYQDEIMIWKITLVNTAMICVVIFAAGFNMTDNWAITLNAKYHVPLVTKHAKN